jgi:hypothetical protein
LGNFDHARITEKKVEKDYDTKDITASPSTKAAPKPDFPEGWQYYVKRGSHCVRNPEGRLMKFSSKAEAVEWANG